MLVSIFVPTHNAAGCITETLKHLTAQSYSDLEIWLVDDCSTDNTLDILEEWQHRDTRIKVIRKEENEGFVPFSWNRVLPLFNGEFTLYLSHDDLLEEHCIENLVAKQQETGADCVIPEVRMWKASLHEKEIHPGSWTVHGNSCLNHGQDIVDGRTAFAHMLNYDIPGFALWRTSLIREVGMPTEAWNSDEGMQRIWALHCDKVTFCRESIFYYRITPDSITKGLKPYHLTGLLTQKRLAESAFENGIWWRYPKQVCRFLWQYLKSYRYLHKHHH